MTRKPHDKQTVNWGCYICGASGTFKGVVRAGVWALVDTLHRQTQAGKRCKGKWGRGITTFGERL